MEGGYREGGMEWVIWYVLILRSIPIQQTDYRTLDILAHSVFGTYEEERTTTMCQDCRSVLEERMQDAARRWALVTVSGFSCLVAATVLILRVDCDAVRLMMYHLCCSRG